MEKLTRKEPKVLSLTSKAPSAPKGWQSAAKILYSQNTTAQAKAVKHSRSLNTSAVRILDAPLLSDDFYCNLLDWSSKGIVSVGLENRIFLWNAATGNVECLVEQPASDPIVSCRFTQDGNHLAIGTEMGLIQIWNIPKGKQVRSLTGHAGRVTSLDWSSWSLASGSRDQTIQLHDVRVSRHRYATLTEHTQEICGLAWSPSGKHFASGSNDNSVKIWRREGGKSIHTLKEHSAAVKALAWAPFQHDLLATGGGTTDRSICI
ncbi:The WD repeat Cdc20/Fizzy family like protein, partial [Aduncisulcus paluster]